MGTIDVCIEAGRRRVFASAIDWPGWSRSGRDEEAALEALVGYGDRYAAVLKGSRLGFSAPRTASGLHVVERAQRDATTGTSCGERRGTCWTTHGRSRIEWATDLGEAHDDDARCAGRHAR